MRIKEFHITRYGPLKYRESVMPGDFTLFYGNNEDGKTLTIDALVKLLLGRNVKVFNQIDRVGENPEGFLIIEDNDGREIKFPESGNILSAAGLTQSEYRNIFIIRNSDLSIDREGDFYANITDRLTGLRMEEIHCIMEGLIEIAKITPRGAFRDVSDEKLKTRIGSAADMGKKIDSLNEELIRDEYDGLVEKLVLQAESLERFEQQILSFEDARMREAYER
ncbi:MAG: AAA family ATPase, partial [Spirochaetes bacterium]|nr:AAA family ATPase [Spirochaetota bacterium]